MHISLTGIYQVVLKRNFEWSHINHWINLILHIKFCSTMYRKNSLSESFSNHRSLYGIANSRVKIAKTSGPGHGLQGREHELLNLSSHPHRLIRHCCATPRWWICRYTLEAESAIQLDLLAKVILLIKL